MSYYKTCTHCGVNLDPGEICDCQDSLRNQFKAEVLSLTEEEHILLLRSWQIHKAHPELSKEECIERAARGATNTQDGKGEQIKRPVSASIVTEAEG